MSQTCGRTPKEPGGREGGGGKRIYSQRVYNRRISEFWATCWNSLSIFIRLSILRWNSVSKFPLVFLQWSRFNSTGFRSKRRLLRLSAAAPTDSDSDDGGCGGSRCYTKCQCATMCTLSTELKIARGIGSRWGSTMMGVSQQACPRVGVGKVLPFAFKSSSPFSPPWRR